jgi:hypothetical protein
MVVFEVDIFANVALILRFILGPFCARMKKEGVAVFLVYRNDGL